MALRQSLSFGPFELDPRAGLKRGGRMLHLTPKALALITELASRPGEVISKAELFRAVWPNAVVTDAVLATCIREIRRALRDDATRPRFIETVHRRGYRFLDRGAAPAAAVFTAPPGPGRVLIGRAAELGVLETALAGARDGRRQLVFVSGDAGIGKTALVEAFLGGVRANREAQVAFGHCVERQESSEAYQPLLDALVRWGRQPEGKALVAVLDRHAPTWLAQMPSLVPPDRLRQLARLTAGSTRQRMLRELTEALETVAASKPLILVLEDMHWSDPSTVDWLAAFARRPEAVRLLVIVTDRPAESIAARHRLRNVMADLLTQGRARELVLSDLRETDCAEYMRSRFPPAPDMEDAIAALARQVHAHTEGRPLVLVSVADDLVANGRLAATAAGWVVRAGPRPGQLAIPRDIDRIVERRLERLDDSGRIMLEAASVAGARFSAAALAPAVDMPVAEVELVCASISRSTQLVAADGIDEWPDGVAAARFSFAHALYREAIYARVPAARARLLHHHVGLRMERAFAGCVAEAASELAMHFERSRDFPKAIEYLRQTGQTAARRGASVEALGNFEKALHFLDHLPPSRERDETEIALRISSGSMHMAVNGWGAPQASEAFLRARSLCESLGFPLRLFPALWGTWLCYWGQGARDTAREIADHLMSLVREATDSSLVLQAQHASWTTYYATGDLERAHAHAAAGIEIYRADRHADMAPSYGNHDAGVCCRMFAGRTLALMGRAAEATKMAEDAIALARELRHPFTLAVALFSAATVYQVLKQPGQTAPPAAEARILARDHGFRLAEAWTTAIGGWATVHAGDAQKGIASIREGIEMCLKSGSEAFVSHLLGLLAEARLLTGQTQEGLETVRQARSLTERTGERFYEAELLRLNAQLLAAQPSGRREAERLFQQSIALARRQNAHLFVLRSCLDLARMWLAAGRRDEVAALMRPACAAVNEEPGPVDLADARAILAGAGD